MRENTPMLAAALAFYALLSLAPALVVVVAVAGMWFGRASAEAELIAKVHEMFGAIAADVVGDVLGQARSHTSAATAAGLVSMFFGATVAFSALQDSLNLVWGVRAAPRGIISSFFLSRLLSFAVVLVMGVVLLASLVLAAALAAVAHLVPASLPASPFLLQAAEFVGSFALMTVMFAGLYRILPDAPLEGRPRWRDIWVGAAVTALLFTGGKTLIALYLGHTTTGSAYGAAGSLVIFLLWIYYSAQILLFGAVFTQQYA